MNEKSSLNKLDVKILQVEGKVEFHLFGAINETFAPFVDQLIKKIPRMPTIFFNFSGITIINSSGTREWTRLIKHSLSAEVILSHCPKVIIDQVNTVEGFIGPNCDIISFYVPYFNESINKEKSLLYEKGKQFTQNEIKVTAEINDGQNTYFLDVIESKFFKFLQKPKTK